MEYASSQVKRARGQDKWVNNPQPEEVPRREDFCWVILGPWPGSDEGAGTPPLRPRRLHETTVDLSEYHCAGLEHFPNVYRLYHYGSGARGVLRGGKITVESIPTEDEGTHIRGLLICDEAHYEQARRDHCHYWTWRRERNEARWRTQEAGEIDYDPKNMMHTLRLLHSAGHLLEEGAPVVRFEYDELLEVVDAETRRLEELLERSRLPEGVDDGQVEDLLREVTALQLET